MAEFRRWKLDPVDDQATKSVQLPPGSDARIARELVCFTARPLLEASAHCMQKLSGKTCLGTSASAAQTSRNAAAKGDELDKSGPTTSMKQQVGALRARPALSSNVLKLSPGNAAAKRQHRCCRPLLPRSCCASVPSRSICGKAPCCGIV